MARGTIRQRSKNRRDRWTIQAFLRRDPVTGKREYHTETVTGSRSDAERRLREVLQEIDGGRLVRAPRLTFRQFLDSWLRDHGDARLRARTAEGYRGYIDRYIGGDWGRAVGGGYFP